MGFKRVTMKVPNMRKEASFILYPYNGDDTIYLQSSGRFARVNLRTGEGVINGKTLSHANSMDLAINPVPFQLPEAVKIDLQGYLWNNSGIQSDPSGCLHIENKELFSA